MRKFTPTPRYTEEDVQIAIKRVLDGVPDSEIAEELGKSISSVTSIRRGKSYVQWTTESIGRMRARVVRSSTRGSRRLTQEEVMTIVHLVLEDKYSDSQISLRFNKSRKIVRSIRTGKSYTQWTKDYIEQMSKLNTRTPYRETRLNKTQVKRIVNLLIDKKYRIIDVSRKTKISVNTIHNICQGYYYRDWTDEYHSELKAVINRKYRPSRATVEQAEEIRHQFFTNGRSQISLSEEYGIPKSTIGNIVNKRYY